MELSPNSPRLEGTLDTLPAVPSGSWLSDVGPQGRQIRTAWEGRCPPAPAAPQLPGARLLLPPGPVPEPAGLWPGREGSRRSPQPGWSSLETVAVSLRTALSPGLLGEQCGGCLFLWGLSGPPPPPLSLLLGEFGCPESLPWLPAWLHDTFGHGREDVGWRQRPLSCGDGFGAACLGRSPQWHSYTRVSSYASAELWGSSCDSQTVEERVLGKTRAQGQKRTAVSMVPRGCAQSPGPVAHTGRLRATHPTSLSLGPGSQRALEVSASWRGENCAVTW